MSIKKYELSEILLNNRIHKFQPFNTTETQRFYQENNAKIKLKKLLLRLNYNSQISKMQKPIRCKPDFEIIYECDYLF